MTRNSNLCCRKNAKVRQTLTWKQSMPTFSQITPYVSMVDTDQEKALSILRAKFRNHSVEEKKKKKKKKEKRKKEKRKKEKKKKRKKGKMEKWICLTWTDESCSEAAFYKIECQVLGCSNPASLFIFFFFPFSLFPFSFFFFFFFFLPHYGSKFCTENR